MTIDVIIIFMLGVLCGAIVSNIFHFIQTAAGTLKIDRTNHEKDIYRLEIGDLDALFKKKRVILKVDSNFRLSQK